jgi:hypothetical protein
MDLHNLEVAAYKLLLSGSHEEMHFVHLVVEDSIPLTPL